MISQMNFITGETFSVSIKARCRLMEGRGPSKADGWQQKYFFARVNPASVADPSAVFRTEWNPEPSFIFFTLDQTISDFFAFLLTVAEASTSSFSRAVLFLFPTIDMQLNAFPRASLFVLLPCPLTCCSTPLSLSLLSPIRFPLIYLIKVIRVGSP